jgi:EAL domain-containing protein (putative c-di-GMP-specific phosphodiesterase class I)
MEQLRATLEEPFTIEGLPVQAEASVGAALYPLHGQDALTLFRHADIAMYEAKREHEGYLIYDISHDRYSPRRLALMGALRTAITRNELRLFYQPKVDLKTNTICSVEALVRWQHPEFGFVPPDQFIPLAEQSGLITQLTFWVLETAVRQCREWMDMGFNLSIAVNLSMWDLREAILPDVISNLLTRYDVPARLLRVELTESTMMTDVERALAVLMRLSEQGIQVSVDDFGTGYSSLAYLKRLPINELKIDRSFVQHITNTETDATIVRSTVMMAHCLGLQVVAEGVEDEATSHLLSDLKCDLAQGYFISRPVPAPALISWLRETGAKTA